MDASRPGSPRRPVLTCALLAVSLLTVSACQRVEKFSESRPPAEASASSAADRSSVRFGVWPGAPVVLISIDTLRSDRLPAYGYKGVDTPAIDALRDDGILFEQAYSHYPLTLPSHVTVLSGQLPTETGVRGNAGYRLRPDSEVYLPNLLRRAGYATGAAVSSFAIRAATGLAQGFDLYDDEVDHEAGGVWGPERAGPHTLIAALKWLDQSISSAAESSQRPFFLFFHLYEPHLPHAPPEPFLSRYGETYEGEIAAADTTVGELMEALEQRGFYDEALIVLLSDHGEGLDDHLEEGHGTFLYREQLQVPLILKLPGSHRAGASVGAPVQLADIQPTILDLLGLEVPKTVSGVSLLRSIEGETRSIYAETMYPRIHYGWSELTSLTDGRYHYIEAPQPELYDLEADPAELDNLLLAEPVGKEQRDVYRRMRDRLAELHVSLEMPAEEDAATRRKLAALGYLATSGVRETGADPKVALPRSLKMMKTAFNLFNEGHLRQSIPAFEALLDENPKMIDAWHQLGTALHATGRPEEALEALETALRLSRGAQRIAVQIGLVLVDLGREAEARAYVDLAKGREPVLAAELGIEIALAEGNLDSALDLAGVSSGPERVSEAIRRRLGLILSQRGRHDEALAMLSPMADEVDEPANLNALARTLLNAGRMDQAEVLVERVLGHSPGNAVALEHRGLIALSRGRPAPARDALLASLAADDQRANAWNLLGVARFQLGAAAGALDAWEKSVQLDPEQWDSLYNLGVTAARLGQRDRARRALRQYIDTAPRDRLGREITEANRLLTQLEG